MASSTRQSISRLHDDKPAFIYGTAWKKEHTKRLVKEALAVGFRSVDTAAQPRHYQEALVGEALREAYTQGLLTRDELYLQTKYTTPAGQDLNNMPYDPNVPLDTQIHTSVASSLQNLRHETDSPDQTFLDCLLLHSPLPTIEQTLQAWTLLETYVPHRIRSLGISNVTLPVLEALYQSATVKPSVVQNRFYPQTRFDVPLRNFCTQHGIEYQSFWTLTGNPALLRCDPVVALAQAVHVEIPVALYALVMDRGVAVLNGSTSTDHMRSDLQGIAKVREWAAANPRDFADISRAFEDMVG
ncbi:uncharacterized protein SETTUDRAFT_108102 [Exserohilum turcica Et28A]|uniref:NADP-dependent oxidoreductase domain-containing protein n=1 Tax=Exserohilum turcicum (strain 28A) TaxID=671987 RepID=R0ITH9_EXST2|nr:uncharacterized protein SETTUDRAFT_108102 [Exserohilum turcica Et28A]EOA88100.1 hypothetical protein SETTUDRAFT_108102 [Exserohilum turcica Et28A]